MSSPLTTHVLDTANGRPAAGVHLHLERQVDGAWVSVSHGVTDDDGRCRSLLSPGGLHAGVWRLSFAVGAWYAARGERGFYPEVGIAFEVTAPAEHHHVPLLLSPFGYSTYRGS